MNPGEPLSTRIPRMRAYNQLTQELDSGGAHYSQDLSEVDLSDLENLKVRVNDPQGDVLVELGSSEYLRRYKTYVSHVQEWRQQFQKLESVNLRYDNQVIVNPEMEAKAKQAALSASAARAAVAAGVKPAVLTTRLNPHDRSVPKPVFELTDKKLDPKTAAAKRAIVRPKPKKVAAKTGKSVGRKEAARHPAAAPKSRVATAHAAPPKRDVKKPAQSAVVAHSSIPKPSPAIAKPTAGTSPNN